MRWSNQPFSAHVFQKTVGWNKLKKTNPNKQKNWLQQFLSFSILLVNSKEIFRGDSAQFLLFVADCSQDSCSDAGLFGSFSHLSYCWGGKSSSCKCSLCFWAWCHEFLCLPSYDRAHEKAVFYERAIVGQILGCRSIFGRTSQPGW